MPNSIMKSGMFRCSKQLKVIKPVIKPISVDMVNNIFLRDQTSVVDPIKSMNCNSLTPESYNQVTFIVGKDSSFPLRVKMALFSSSYLRSSLKVTHDSANFGSVFSIKFLTFVPRYSALIGNADLCSSFIRHLPIRHHSTIVSNFVNYHGTP